MNYSIEIPSALESLRITAPFTDAVLNELPDMPGRKKLIHDLTLVSSEAVTNALKHGEHEGASIRLSYAINSEAIVITVTDRGCGFDPSEVAIPDFEKSPEGGYGLYIIKSIMDTVQYEQTTDGNNLVLTKNWTVR